MTELEKELEAAVAESLPKAASLHVLQQPNKGVMSSADYMAHIESAQLLLRQKLQHERLSIIAEHDRLWAEIDADTKRRLLEATSRIEREHAEARRALENETRQRLRDNDDLAKRMGEV